jgi:NAD(P)-dependent dehydrogenase (short-subunit alcohol dehydrogenase family)/NH3-dependent NAD+ synthetase
MTTQATIVTGGGRGIGRAIALRMARITAVLAVGRTEADLQEVCVEIAASGGLADFIVGDVSDEATAAQAMDRLQKNGWNIRNLVANAGIAKGGPLVDFDPAVWRQMFGVNVDGTFHFVQACLPRMIEQRDGSISIISSINGLRGYKYDAPYSATKFALVGLAQSLAQELAKHNIVVVPICPGFVESEMTRRTVRGLITHRGIDRAAAEKLVAGANPQGRILRPEEIAEAVAFCTTSAARSTSGQSLEMLGWSDARVLQLVNWVHEKAARAKKLFVPVSGGTDSALNFAVCSKAYPEKTIGVYVGTKDHLRASDWFESTGTLVYIDPIAFPGDAEIARWAQFLELSKSANGWLVGSRNRTEKHTGLYSLASRVATFLPLGNTWKSEVMELCAQIGVPAEVRASSRRADPDCGRSPELAEIPLETIDTFLKVRVGENGEEALQALTPAQVDYLTHVCEQNEFKEHLPTEGPPLLSI